MGESRVCPYCGTWVTNGAHACQLCGRSIAGAATPASQRGTERSATYARPSAPILDVLRSLAQGTTPFALALGPLFIIGYPWLLALYAAQPVGTITSDLVLALVWLVPEAYLLSGVVKAAEYANANRRVEIGLIPPAVSLLLQLLVAGTATRFAPAVSASVPVWGLSGVILLRVAPLTVFALASVMAALVAAIVPRVVPGKFERAFAPQILGFSTLLVALLLPSWGGLAAVRIGITGGMPALWVNVIGVFIMMFVALIWFRSKD